MLKFTGERFVPGLHGVIEAEHMHRYMLARCFAAGMDVLDVACGEGYGAHLLASAALSVVGVDIASDAVMHATEKYKLPNLRYLQGDCASLPLPDSCVDLVVSFETIEHHDQHEAMMLEIKRVLRPDGVLIISSPNRPEFQKTLTKPNHFHIKELDFFEFDSLLRHSFKNVKIYAQRVLTGSVLAPYQHTEGGFANFESGHDIYPFDNLSRPIYFIAAASNVKLPVLGTSVYENPAVVEKQQLTANTHARLYISELVEGQPQPYSEARGATQHYPMDGQPKHLNLSLPVDLQPLQRLRLDMSSSPVAIDLHSMMLCHADGTELWRWAGTADVFKQVLGMVCVPKAGEGMWLVCTNDDPQFVINVPAGVLAKLSAGATLQVGFTPMPLHQALPEVFKCLSQLHKQVEMLSHLSRVPSLAGPLEELNQLVQCYIQQKHEALAAHQAELAEVQQQNQQLYDQLLRAQEQVDLLKEFTRPSMSGRNESL